MPAEWNDDGWNKCVLDKDDLGPREDDLRVLRDVFGVKVVWFAGFDTERQHPDFIPSGKPMRTHSIDAKPVPQFTTSAHADFEVLRRVREKWNYDGMQSFEDALHHLQWQRRCDSETAPRWNWVPAVFDYEPGDYSAAALAAFAPDVLRPDADTPLPPLEEFMKPVWDEAAARRERREAEEAAADDGSVHSEWVVEWDDPRGRGIETRPLVFNGTRTEALAKAREDEWWPEGISVLTHKEWFAREEG